MIGIVGSVICASRHKSNDVDAGKIIGRLILAVCSILLFIAGSKMVVETVPTVMFDSGFGACSSMILYAGFLSKELFPHSKEHYIFIGISQALAIIVQAFLLQEETLYYLIKNDRKEASIYTLSRIFINKRREWYVSLYEKQKQQFLQTLNVGVYTGAIWRCVILSLLLNSIIGYINITILFQYQNNWSQTLAGKKPIEINTAIIASVIIGSLLSPFVFKTISRKNLMFTGLVYGGLCSIIIVVFDHEKDQR